MSLVLILAIGWVFGGVLTAMLPVGRQYVPGVALLIAAPVLLVWIGVEHGWVFAGLGMAAFVSMMRNPLRYLWAKMWEGRR